MIGMKTFGSPERFEISARWMEDPEPRDQRPKEYGWSMGELCIKVGGVILTEHRIHGAQKGAVQWYLAPVVSWLLQNWKWLMHEGSYNWPTHTGDSAAITTAAALERYIASEFTPDRSIYKEVREWWKRHALRSADSSALYPDIFLRRVDDDIEVSWLDRQPEFPPAGFELNLTPGMALLPVEDVARPLWEFLQWTVSSALTITRGDDQLQVNKLQSQFNAISHSNPAELEAVHVASLPLRALIKSLGSELRWISSRKVLPNIPVVSELDTPVLMFGGLSITLELDDTRTLFALLVQQRDGIENDRLNSLVSSPPINEYIQPYVHGYELAYEARAALNVDMDAAFIDVDKLLDKLGIVVREIALQSKSIRGVAIAGNGFSPAIVVNKNSAFNSSKRGRRFTLVHEFCHILYDRSSAKRLSHISGPWASARVEKRANAFAVMFLATPQALKKVWTGEISRNKIKLLSDKFGVGMRALLEHMHNLDLLSDQQFWGLVN